MLLIKFGKKEHLEQLKKGIIHFSEIQTFQHDPTNFRGDKMEGKHYMNPRSPFIINGVDISSYIEEGVFSYEMNCNVLSFSASMISRKNSHKISDKIYTINEDFLQEMEQFGKFCLIFWPQNFISAMKDELNRTKCDYEYHPVTYINKHDYKSIQEYYDQMSEERKRTGHLFVKNAVGGYPLQNEWRFIIFDTKNAYRVNQMGGINIKTCSITNTKMPVLDVANLKTMQFSGAILR